MISLTARTAEKLLSSRGRWIDAHAFVSIGGFAGFTARIRDCRKAPYHLQIENKIVRVKTKRGTIKASYYRLVK